MRAPASTIGEHLVQDLGALLGQDHEPGVVAGELDHGRTEPVCEGRAKAGTGGRGR